MNINRNNYEEYFLMYADNELSPTEKKVVEIFVQENADLKEEFYMIRLTVSSPDEEVVLTDKSFLIKSELSFINEKNYEEAFVLYHDNELSDSQRKETEEFVKQNSKYKTEFEQIEKAKLIPDDGIEYPGKKQLYRAEKPGKVIPLILWRSFAAAIVIGLGIWIALPYFNQQRDTRTIALNGNEKKLPAPVIQNETSENAVGKENEKPGVLPSPSVKEPKYNDLKEEHKPVLSRENQNRNVAVKTELKQEVLPKENTIPIKQDNAPQMVAINAPIKTAPGKIEKIINNSIQTQDAAKSDQNQTAMQEQNSPDIAGNGNDENYAFYNVKSDVFNQTKVGGFLKQVKRIVERNNPITRLIGGEDKQFASK
ncbi:MAG: hypothetical protein Q8891_13070 [Bacteroidota bacterium]|nr:hypothetical protein [Bacteroidota bacterium]